MDQQGWFAASMGLCMPEASIRRDRIGGDDAASVAADWIVRLQAPDLDADEAAAFDAWISAPAHARAYDRALAVTFEIEAAAPQLAEALRDAPTPRRSTASRGWIAAAGVLAAATIALAITPASLFAPAATQAYATGTAEHHTVKLADGSTVELNAGSRISVTLGRHDRRVVMPEGEAVFDVAADSRRPFLIAVGDRTVRVVGTRFDVRHRGQSLSVAVERGVVEVRPADGQVGRVWRLHPGQRLDAAQGEPTARVTAVDPQQMESWRSGRLIYRDAPLGDVVADLNQQFVTPIELEDPSLAQVRVSGVLVLDDQASVIRRLALLAPVKALPSARGVLLRGDGAVKP